MDSDGEASEGQPDNNLRQCLTCDKRFVARHKSHRCCSAVCNANKSRHSQSTGPSRSNKRSLALSPSSDVPALSKKGKTDLQLFLEENSDCAIQDLTKEELATRLFTAVGFLSDFPTSSVESLEDKVQTLSASLEISETRIFDLEEEIVKIKVSFADSILKLNLSASPPPPPSSGPSSASVARGQPTNSVLVANCVPGATLNVLDIHAVEKLLDTPNSGLIPSHVRYKNNKVYVTLDSDIDVAKAATILNGKPDFQTQFAPASKLNVMFPVIALFVNVSDPEFLKKELEHRNKSLRGSIHSVKVVYTKPNTTEGHVKLFLRSKQARDDILFLGKASILGRDFRVVPVDLDREVRRCYKCQQYGHTQQLCSKPVVCGKCSGNHRTLECVVEPSAWKCVNCSSCHQAGNKECAEQVKAVARYRAFLDKHG